ncbi:phosphatidylethanolamine-binding protein [Pisolithus marmoratus]|nr:phosphatidylethanolamine-binding protein [Pisolithus marmoratus]
MIDSFGEVEHALIEADVIPEVVPSRFGPEALLVVSWSTGKEATLGNTLNAPDTALAPSISFTPMATQAPYDEVSYTLVMTDPDAPSRKNPRLAQWRHWVVTGIKAPQLTEAVTGHLSAHFTELPVTPYYGPAPPPGTGPHRYVLLLYREPPSGIRIPPDAPERKNSPEHRAKWDAAAFAEEYGLKLVAANFFYVTGAEP